MLTPQATKQQAALVQQLSFVAQLIEQREYQKAESLLNQLTKSFPSNPTIVNLFGILFLHQGKGEQAVDKFLRAISLNPSESAYYFNAGNAYRLLQQFENASGYFEKAIERKKNYTEAYLNLGISLQSLGKIEEAKQSYQKALEQKPFYEEALLQLANSNELLGNIDECIANYTNLISQNPSNIRSWERYVLFLLRKNIDNAINIILQGIEIHPSSEPLLRYLTIALKQRNHPIDLQKLQPLLVRICNIDTIHTLDVVFYILQLIKQHKGFSFLLEASRKQTSPFSINEELVSFLEDDIVLASLPRILLRDYECEEAFTHLRKHILFSAITNRENDFFDKIPTRFLSSLAQNCQYNEYAFFVTIEEQTSMSLLEEKLQNILSDSSENIRENERLLLLFALYHSLSSLQHVEKLFEIPLAQWSKHMQPLIREQIIYQEQERQLAWKIPSFNNIENETSQKVQQQYEESPYPRWMSLSLPERVTFSSLFKKYCPNTPLPNFTIPIPLLVAGCGTGYQSILLALSFAQSEVVGVDLSRASLAYAQRKAHYFGIKNIAFQQCDILNIKSLGKKFFLVESTGVLHHLRDTFEGWKSLTEVLHPDGLMKIALYSERGRRSVQAAREFVSQKSFPPTEHGIRDARKALMDLPFDHPARGVLDYWDFYSTSMCRDLFMHIQERNVTIQYIATCLEQLNLRFLGFEVGSDAQKKFREMFPDEHSLLDLKKWDMFEEQNPYTFAGMYQFWCCKK